MSERYEMIGGSIVLEETSIDVPDFKVKTPRNDIKELAFMLITLLHENVPSVVWNIMVDDEWKITSQESDV